MNKINLGLEYRVAKASDVAAIDYLVEIGRGRQTIKTASDWAVVAKVFEFWTRRWPEEWAEFSSTIKEIKATRARKDGYSGQLGKSGVRYLAALPPRFNRLLSTIFPFQDWGDRSFMDKFIKNIKIIQVGDNDKTQFYFSV